MNNQTLIDAVKTSVLAYVQPELLLLFGSRARGDAREDSDIDLLVVMDTNAKPTYRSLPIRKALKAIPIGKDILVYTPEEFEAWSSASASLVSRAVQEGIELYRKAA